jgi:hypothetical protein
VDVRGSVLLLQIARANQPVHLNLDAQSNQSCLRLVDRLLYMSRQSNQLPGDTGRLVEKRAR